MRLIHAFLQIAILVAAACHSSPARAGPESGWQALPDGVPAQWRTLHLYSGACAFVLASDESAAKEVYEVAVVANRACAQALGRAPARGLLIAVSEKDPLLIEDPAAMVEALQRWNAQATGRDTPPARHRGMRGDGSDDPEITRLAARLLAGGIPKDEPSLALPVSLREHLAHVVLLSTSSCLEKSCAALIDAALEKSDVGWFQLQLVKALASPTARMTAEMKRFALATVVDVWIANDAVTPAQADAIVERAGVAGVLRRPSDPSSPR